MVYAITSREIENDDLASLDVGVITGRVGLYKYFTCSIFYSGALRSFFSTTFTRLSKLATKPLLESLNVALPMREVVVRSKVVIRCPLMLCGHIL